MRAQLFLADWAEVISGKLYIQGAGWSLTKADAPAGNRAVAVLIHVPWSEANRKHTFHLALYTEDGVVHAMPDGQQLEIQGDFEAGRKPGIVEGMDLLVPLAYNIGGLSLPRGGYEFVLSINDQVADKASFQAL